ncbi:MAG: hypothetical protein IJ378_06240 [Alistipes sp.]|nr:hypothetical protein [Alistipes sp.]
MKKLFIAAMALATIVSCSKDDGDAVLTSNKKSVAITIANQVPVSRAVTSPAGSSADLDLTSTSADKLVFIFADSRGNRVTALDINDAVASTVDNVTTYTFHSLDQTVAKVGVIANGVTTYTKNNSPASLKAAEDEWMKETTDCEYKQIIVYGSDDLTRAKNADDTDATCEVNHVEYPLFEAEVFVEPYHARIEIPSVSCTDMGEDEYGYNKLTVNSLTLNGKYSQPVGVQFDVTKTPAVTSASAGPDKTWSWNIHQQDVSDLVVSIKLVEGKNWTIPAGTEDTSVTVVGYTPDSSYKTTDNIQTAEDGTKTIKQFLRGEIYRLSIPFSESNIDNSDNKICANVKVHIANWVIVPVTPVFGTN